MSNEPFASVWDAIEDTPAGAENMKVRSALMMALEKQIRDHGWTQAEAARRTVEITRYLSGERTLSPSGIR